MANSNGWGDGAANNAIGWGQGANNAIGWGDSHAKSWAGLTDIAGFDSAAISYFNATGISGATQQDAIDNLIRGLKDDGIWSKMKAVYPFVTDNRNLFSYTEDFGNAFWFKNAVTITNNSITAPNGTLTADSIVENTANTQHYVGVVSGLTLTAVPYTISAYFKKANRNWASVGLFNGTDSKSAWFDLDTGTIGTVDSGATATITDSGNGWYRCSVTRTMAAVSNNFVAFSPQISDGSSSHLGNGLVGVYCWGAQLELGSTATTYQPITTTQQAFIANQFKYNLVNPVDSDAAFRLVFNGGWTHSSNGATPNGTNGWANTYLQPSSVLTQNSTHLSFYSRSNILNTFQFEIGSFTLPSGLGSSSFGISYNLSPNGHMRNRISASTPSTGFIPTDSRGLFTLNRTLSTQQKAYQNGVLKETANVNSDGLSILEIAIGANRTALTGGFIVGDYSAKQCAFSTIGNGLTDTEAANLYTRVQAFQTALNRQV
jgi:hypothetical protein